jgi:uncharacterized RDD family membrane protein YckC
VTTPAQNPEQEKARRQVMAGAMLVLGACVFGGLAAVVLMALGQRSGAAVVAISAGVAILAGVGVQVSAFRKLKASSQAPGK